MASRIWDIYKKLLPAVLYIFIFSIPFGTRKLIWQFTEGFNEYNAAFIYGTDVLMIFLLICFLSLRVRQPAEKQSPINARLPRLPADRQVVGLLFAMTGFILFSALPIFFAYSKGLALYNFARLFILMLFALMTSRLLADGIIKFEKIFAILGASAAFQAIIGIIQFIKQGSLGLYFFGEPHLDVVAGGIAKITVEGAKILRVYGTFPHPNVLAAFLLLGLFSFYYLWLRNDDVLSTGSGNIIGRAKSRPYLIISIIIIIFGLILTFSRAAWLVGGAISLIFFTYIFWKNEFRRQAAQLFLISGLSVVIFVSVLFPYIAARAPIMRNEPSVTRRLQYNEMALDLIKNKPFGVGLGNQVLFSVREGYYKKFGMNEPWMWEPIHNAYLLVFSELGIISGIFFSLFILGLIISNFRMNFLNKLEKYPSSEFASREVFFIFLAFLLLGLFDHYLWTLQPGRLMLWLVIGIIMGSDRGLGSRSSTDRTLPSEGRD